MDEEERQRIVHGRGKGKKEVLFCLVYKEAG